MSIHEVPPLSEQAFHSADKSKIKDGVLALMREIKQSNGSISSVNPYRRYDLYTLLSEYINDAEFRIKVHELLIKSGKMTRIENRP